MRIALAYVSQHRMVAPMNARAYRYFAAATVALAIAVALFADIQTAPVDPATVPTIASTPFSNPMDTSQPAISPEPEPPADIVTDSGFDGEFGAPMIRQEETEGGPLAPFGEPQMETEPQAF